MADKNTYLYKTAKGGGPLAWIAGLSPPALYALAATPVVVGAAGGYGYNRLKSPGKEDFRNLGKERLLATIRSQMAETKKMNELREAREEQTEGKEGITDVGQSAQKEIHIG